MKLLNHKIRPSWDTEYYEVLEESYIDVNTEFIESVAELVPIESYKVVQKTRKTLWGYEVKKSEEVLDKVYNLYQYTMSSGDKYLFDISFDIETKKFKEEE